MLKSNNGGLLVKWIGNSDPLWMDVKGYIDNIFRFGNNKVYKKVRTIREYGSSVKDDLD